MLEVLLFANEPKTKSDLIHIQLGPVKGLKAPVAVVETPYCSVSPLKCSAYLGMVTAWLSSVVTQFIHI